MAIVLELVPYLIVLMAAAVAVVMLTSKTLSEKLVTAGLLPRVFLNLAPMIQRIMKAFGITLVITGAFGIGIQSGWINREYLARYGFPGALLLMGLVIVLLSSRNH
jgi:hypothetical protein